MKIFVRIREYVVKLNTYLPPCWKITIPMMLTKKPRIDTSNKRSCLTSIGSTNLSTAFPNMKKLMKTKNKLFPKPAKTSALA